MCLKLVMHYNDDYDDNENDFRCLLCHVCPGAVSKWVGVV